MNFRKSSLIAFATAFLLGGAAWLHAEVKLIDPDYDFGIVRELSGIQSGKAHIVNYGPDTIQITGVRPSCGCTGADYADGPVAPGDTAVINFTYDPFRRPGSISKTVKVYAEPGGQRFVIRLGGRVVGTPQTLSRNYPVECGPLRLSESTIELRNVKPSTGRHAFIRMVNQSMDTITPVWDFDNPALSIAMSPERLAPGEIGSMGIYLNTRFEPRSGNVEYKIPISTAEDSVTTTVTLKANILQPDTLSGKKQG